MATREALKILIQEKLATATSITASEHRDVEYAIVDSCKPYIIGRFTLGDIGGTAAATGISGFASATVTATTNVSKIAIVFSSPNPIPTANYYVRTFLQGLSSNVAANDTVVSTPIFANLATTGFDMYIREPDGAAQNIKVYFEVVPLD